MSVPEDQIVFRMPDGLYKAQGLIAAARHLIQKLSVMVVVGEELTPTDMFCLHVLANVYECGGTHTALPEDVRELQRRLWEVRKPDAQT